MSTAPRFRTLAGIWAGLVIGGSLIAAPAKFNAPSLTLSVALDVGRAQFAWLAIGEAVLCLGLLVALRGQPRHIWLWVAAPMGLFALQQLALMPALDARTVRIMAGEILPASALHLVYVGVECAKVLLLTGIALWRPRR
jgi:hypothetical protein